MSREQTSEEFVLFGNQSSMVHWLLFVRCSRFKWDSLVILFLKFHTLRWYIRCAWPRRWLHRLVVALHFDFFRGWDPTVCPVLTQRKSVNIWSSKKFYLHHSQSDHHLQIEDSDIRVCAYHLLRHLKSQSISRSRRNLSVIFESDKRNTHAQIKSPSLKPSELSRINIMSSTEASVLPKRLLLVKKSCLANQDALGSSGKFISINVSGEIEAHFSVKRFARSISKRNTESSCSFAETTFQNYWPETIGAAWYRNWSNS